MNEKKYDRFKTIQDTAYISTYYKFVRTQGIFQSVKRKYMQIWKGKSVKKGTFQYIV